MREIIFRGISTTTGEWHYGNLTILTNADFTSHDKGSYISNRTGGRPFAHQVLPETVSQYTCFKDIDDNEIYEGHILDDDDRFAVYFRRGSFFAANYYEETDLDFILKLGEFKIIGDIHQNPGLLKKEK